MFNDVRKWLNAGGIWQGVTIYTVLWLICSTLLICIFNSNGKTFFWSPDGFYEHFASFFYLCDYLKDLVYNHQFSGFFNYTLGQGMDIITTLGGYDFTDPVSFLCALIFPLTEANRYTLMVFAKLYLIGFSFLFYCYSTGRKEAISVAAGAIAYTFSGAILYTFARHPNFINWAYFFPFLMGGIELYFRRGKRIPLVLFIFWNLLTSYYTFYYSAVLGFIYVLVHAVCNILKDKTSASVYREIKNCVCLAGVCCIGVLLSAVVLFPSIYAYLGSDRVGILTGYIASAWHYPLVYYKRLFAYIFIALHGSGFYTHLGLNAVVAIPLILIFLKGGKHSPLKWLIFLSFLMLCIPLAGRVMNGFSYAVNRWSFVIPFYVSVAFVTLFPEIKEMSNREKFCVYLVILVYVLSVCFIHLAGSLKYSAVIMLAVVTSIIGIALHYKWLNYKFLMTSLVVAGAFFQIYSTFAKNDGGYVHTFVDTSAVTARMKNWSNTAAPNSNVEFYRTEMAETRLNTAGFTGVKGTGFWWSLVPASMMDYHINLALSGIPDNCYVSNLEGRTSLLSLASVKYFTQPTKETGIAPFGYEEIPSTSPKYKVFENKFALPIGYSYSHFIPSSAYNALNGIEKEQVLLQGVVLDTIPDGFKQADVVLNQKVLDFEIAETKRLKFDKGKIIVPSKSGTITIKTIIPDNHEVYLYIKGAKLKKNRAKMEITATRKTGTVDVRKTGFLSNETYTWFVSRNDLTFNLGIGSSGENTITITCSKGTITYKEFQIIAVPMASYVDSVKNLGTHVLENINVGRDKITGFISLPEKRILQLSIPYSPGWKAFADEKETSLLRSNVMYMAIPLSEGNHAIELRYRTPYLKEGLLVSGFSALLWTVYELRRRKKDNSRLH